MNNRCGRGRITYSYMCPSLPTPSSSEFHVSCISTPTTTTWKGKKKKGATCANERRAKERNVLWLQKGAPPH